MLLKITGKIKRKREYVEANILTGLKTYYIDHTGLDIKYLIAVMNVRSRGNFFPGESGICFENKEQTHI